MSGTPSFLSSPDFAHLFPYTPSSWREVNERGFTTARRYVVDFENNTSVFVKVACDELTSRWLKSEKYLYSEINAPFMPRYYGAGHTPAGMPFLVLEDLSGAHWPPPWTSDQIALVRETLNQLHQLPAPKLIPNLEDLHDEMGGWGHIAQAPEGFLSLGLADRSWLDHSLPALLKAESEATLQGNDLVHWDIRSDNLCFTHDGIKVIDWNHACRGNGAFDLIGWLPSLALEGGPMPWEITMDEPGLIAIMAGYFAHRAPLEPPHPGSLLRQAQRNQLTVALPWACRALDLPLPTALADKEK